MAELSNGVKGKMSEKLAIVPVDEKNTALMPLRVERQLSYSARENTRAQIEDNERKAEEFAHNLVQDMIARGILQEDSELNPYDEQDIKNTVSRSIERHRTRH